jgi:hypothetical protein
MVLKWLHADRETGRQTDRQTDMAYLTVLQLFTAKVPKKYMEMTADLNSFSLYKMHTINIKH